MIKLALTLTVVTVFAIGSAVAASCGGCTDGKDKDKCKDKKKGAKECHSYTISL